MSARDEFWRYVCSYDVYLYLLLVVVTVLAVLNLFSVLLAPQTQGAFIVSLLVFGILGITAAGIGFVLWRCQQR